MTTVLYYISISIATIWMMITIYTFIVLLHESLTLKDPKAFVHKWTDFFGIMIYFIIALLAGFVIVVEFILSPRREMSKLFDRLRGIT